jgi:short-subunit dehydrogenase
MGAYDATRAAMLSLSESLHAAMSECGVHVVVLCPTFVRTRILQTSRMAEGVRSRTQTLMDRKGTDPERVARETLDALDRNDAHAYDVLRRPKELCRRTLGSGDLGTPEPPDG